LGLHASQQLLAELNALAFSEDTLRLVEDLIAFLRDPKVQVRLFQQGFLHAKAYIFHQDQVGPGNYGDRLRPFAAMVGSSNFTAPGLTTNKELNLVHRVFTEADEAVDAQAAQMAEYLRTESAGEVVPAQTRRAIKNEVVSQGRIGWLIQRMTEYSFFSVPGRGLNLPDSIRATVDCGTLAASARSRWDSLAFRRSRMRSRAIIARMVAMAS
jgi:phosphatidylserine/phosphatidylglycerophosphate/cardiolipin synthase-like enzyme